MKLIKLICFGIALFLFSQGGYAQFGSLSNKVKNAAVNKIKNKSEKTDTAADKATPTDKTADATTTAPDTKETNVNANTMADESNTVTKKYFLYEDVKLIPGATFYFSDKPFGNSHEGSKTNFKSNGFIYGRLELKNQTLAEAFKLTPIGTNYYLILSFGVVNGTEGKYAQVNNNAVMLKPDEIRQTAFNFDVLPEPDNATTGIGMNYEYGFDALHVLGGPMYQIIDQSTFPNDGDYTVQLQFYFRPVDGWGKGLPNSSDWPGVEGAFRFNFNAADVASIKKNFTAVYQAVKTTAFMLHTMPDYWPKISRKLTDPSLSSSALEAMIKKALTAEEKVLVKYAIANNSDGGGWIVQKNDLGVPTYQLLNENVYTIYKSEGKCFVGDVNIAKDYLGGGKYGSPYVRNINVATSGYGTAIDCSAIK